MNAKEAALECAEICRREAVRRTCMPVCIPCLSGCGKEQHQLAIAIDAYAATLPVSAQEQPSAEQPVAQPADEVSGLVEWMRNLEPFLDERYHRLREVAAALESLAQENLRLCSEVVNRNKRALEGDQALAAFDAQYERAEYAEARAAAAETALAQCRADAGRYKNARESMFYEREANRAQIEHLVKHLSGIHALIQPDHIKLPDGRVMEFAPKAELILECWRALSQAIRDVPKAIDAALASAGKGKA